MKTKYLILILITSIGMNSCIKKTKQAKKSKQIMWENSLTLPACQGMEENVGLAGAFSGFVDGKLIILGGANFPVGFPWTGGQKKWWTTLYSTSDLDSDTPQWEVHDNFIEYPVGYGTSIQLNEGLLCIGGCDEEQCYSDVFFIKMKNNSLIIDRDTYPDLPIPLANASGVLLENKIYLMGGQKNMTDEASLNCFYVLDLVHKDKGWVQLEPWGQNSKAYAVATAQAGEIFLFSGRSFAPSEETIMHTDGYSYNPKSNKWKKLEGKFPFMAGTTIPYQDDKILFMGGVNEILPTTPEHPGFSNAVQMYDIKERTLSYLCTSPYPIPVTTNIVSSDSVFYITSGEIRPGIRTPHILKIKL